MVESEVKWGSDGPHVFWRTLEILAAEEAFESPLVIDFNTLARWYPGLRKPRLKAVLAWWSERRVIEASSKAVRARIEASFNSDGTVSLFCGKLVRISDTYTKKVRTKVEQYADNVPAQKKKKKEKKKQARHTGQTLFSTTSDPSSWTPQSQLPSNGTHDEYLANMVFWMQNATTEYIQELHEDYPLLNVTAQMNALYRWAKANPKKRRLRVNSWIRNCFLKEESRLKLRQENSRRRQEEQTQTPVYHPRPVK